MKPLLIVRTGRAPDVISARHGDFPRWFRLGLRLPAPHVRVVDVEQGDSLPDPDECAGAVITGSASMVTERLPWSERTAGWIRDAMDVDLPLLGVCYGHQLMSHALGGRVDYLPGGREMGTVSLTTSTEHAAGDTLATSLPNRFHAHATHEQSVMELPPGAVSLARSERDPHHLVRYGTHAVSTQFHPEFSAEVMRAYIRRKHDVLREEGQAPDDLLAAVVATPAATMLLRRFVREHLQAPRATSAA
ncbi:GMP synthase [Luteibacter rhizovicinus DSM 16549]|uniref:GMP synthase n=1 Tax=Luteibacter rhizovicinus DSM 16549 TaxID=1440763 RepID=A0A0G9HB19_9GAMM|nr:glutamine amidotransferase [Luteibacter rhizovicinus]APG03951.1 GMP synthase [Luteibacter rhizovicinus DSM 16549]KLD66434.1 glutamine amidotransferase [Luteibacter rhizovicinus DSM 16549]KLD77402.1 glutamine amidotransferase [Xanthomonas hyacinthi DSM 19077]